MEKATMNMIEKSIDVDVPIRVAYNQWTQFETFPRFLEGVERIDQPQRTLAHWVTRTGALTHEFDVEIVEQRPDECLTWRTLTEARHEGTVTFESLGPDRTRVSLRLDLEAGGVIEKTGSALHLARGRVHRGMESFKEFIEGHGRETGGWRGEIRSGRVRPDPADEAPRVPTWPTG
ncbi:SRPBCC family protein [Streptomyces sp. NPDC059892]|uniref:SRPBCC family protein n=1 Tax=Streptomyces sp. NPDC059892 TaxID=3346989 RepID=UPI0036672361